HHPRLVEFVCEKETDRLDFVSPEEPYTCPCLVSFPFSALYGHFKSRAHGPAFSFPCRKTHEGEESILFSLFYEANVIFLLKSTGRCHRCRLSALKLWSVMF